MEHNKCNKSCTFYMEYGCNLGNKTKCQDLHIDIENYEKMYWLAIKDNQELRKENEVNGLYKKLLDGIANTKKKIAKEALAKKDV